MLKQAWLTLLCLTAELITEDYKWSSSKGSAKEDTKAHC